MFFYNSTDIPFQWQLRSDDEMLKEGDVPISDETDVTGVIPEKYLDETNEVLGDYGSYNDDDYISDETADRKQVTVCQF